MSDITWLAIAFGAVWLAIGVYLLTIQTRQKDLERRIEQLHKRT